MLCSLAIGGFAGVEVALGDESPLPNVTLTPGAVLAVGTDDICRPGYTRLIRSVPAAVRHEVYASYGVTNVPGQHELDHLIPLELGGSNAKQNLWPEPYHTYWNAHVKDGLERKLHNLVCSHQLSLTDAQQAIASNWIAAYQKYMNHPPHEAK